MGMTPTKSPAEPQNDVLAGQVALVEFRDPALPLAQVKPVMQPSGHDNALNRLMWRVCFGVIWEPIRASQNASGTEQEQNKTVGLACVTQRESHTIKSSAG